METTTNDCTFCGRDDVNTTVVEHEAQWATYACAGCLPNATSTTRGIMGVLRGVTYAYRMWIRDVADHLYNLYEPDELTDADIITYLDSDIWTSHLADEDQNAMITVMQVWQDDADVTSRVRDVRVAYDACVQARG